MSHDIAIMHVMYITRASEKHHHFYNLLCSRLRLRLDDPFDDFRLLHQECSEDAITENMTSLVWNRN